MERPERERTERRRELRERYEDIPLPETHPAFVTAMADVLDYLWVREYHLPGEGGSIPLWTVFDPEGRVRGGQAHVNLTFLRFLDHQVGVAAGRPEPERAWSRTSLALAFRSASAMIPHAAPMTPIPANITTVARIFPPAVTG